MQRDLIFGLKQTPSILSVDIISSSLQRARTKIRFTHDLLSNLDVDEWISLIFLILDPSMLAERGYNYSQYPNYDRLKVIVSSLETGLDGTTGSSFLEDFFDPVIEALYVIGRYDILVDELDLCLEHSLHQVCKNLQALNQDRLALYKIFAGLTQDEAKRLISLRLPHWHFPNEEEPFELIFCRNLNPHNYRGLITELHGALISERLSHLAIILSPHIDSNASLQNSYFSSHGDVYPLPSEGPHGVCIIINVKNFLPPKGPEDDICLEMRRGSDIDSDRLEGTFKLFGFAIVHLLDPGFDKLHEFFTHLRRDKRLCDIACLVVCVMTHGDENDNLYLHDRSCIAVTELRKLCYTQSLIGKPRLYFVQACRGDQSLRPVLLQRDSTTTSNSESDCLISAATVRGYSAMRSQSSGSWFITDLCSSLQEIGHLQPLKSVLKKTRKKLMERVDKFGGGYVTQISEDKDTLTKEVHLVRGGLDIFLEGITDLTMLEVLEEEIDSLVSHFLEEPLETTDPFLLQLFAKKFGV